MLVYSAMRDNLNYNTHKDVVPVGWYTVPNDDGDDCTVFVYDHQLYGYNQLKRDIENKCSLTQKAKFYIDHPAYFAGITETDGQMQEEWPPKETELNLIIKYAINSGQMPLFYTFKQRDDLDPYQIADELGE